MNKKSMSVTEMRKMLGIGKSDSYWLVKKGYFETVIIAGKMRVMVDSFEKWYDNQLHYKKVDGTPPGKNWTGITFSVREVAELLGVSDSSIYELIKKILEIIPRKVYMPPSTVRQRYAKPCSRSWMY